VTGGVGGVLLSLGLTRLLSSMFYSLDSEGHPLYYDFSPEPAVILAVLTISVAAGFLFGLLPAIKSTGVGLADSLKCQASGVSVRLQLGWWLVGALR